MKLLVTDYDNTFELHYEYTDNENILKRNIYAINKFICNNLVCIATGRHFAAIYETLVKHNIKFNYLCANNGAELYDNKFKLLFCNPINKNDLLILKKLNINTKIFFRHPYKSKLITSVNMYIDDINRYNEIKQILNNNINYSYIEYKFPKIKIINKNCNKVNIIKIIQNLNSILDNNIYTIGDDINDLDMIIKYNGYSLISSNEEVKKNAQKIYDELNQLIYDLESN